MTPDQFCYWLQGFDELNGAPPTAEQWKSISDHLALVFKKVTPNVEAPNLTLEAQLQRAQTARPRPADPDYLPIQRC